MATRRLLQAQEHIESAIHRGAPRYFGSGFRVAVLHELVYVIQSPLVLVKNDRDSLRPKSRDS